LLSKQKTFHASHVMKKNVHTGNSQSTKKMQTTTSISFYQFLTKNRKICEGKEVCHCSDVALVLMTNESTQEIGEELYQDVRKGTTTLGVESYE
jgi:tartrate dehydratase alpha subunit/fumarate hydratase class I-like protein